MPLRAVILSLLALAPAAAQAPPPAPTYPIAVWYGGGKARAPMQEADPKARRAEWKRDLEQIRSLGFPAVKTWVEWASSERQEGKLRLDNLEQLLELADELGLRVIVQLYADSAPDWVGVRYPDARYVAQSGAAIPSQAAPGFCTDHAEVARLVLGFYRAVAERARRHRSFYAYDLWSEPHIINWAIINYIPDPQFCFCPHTLRKFRAWLEKKHGSLEALNAAWYRGFARWDEVEPPRFGTILSYTDYIDWKSFIADKLADDLRQRARAVKEVDRDHAATSHAAVPSIFTSPYAGDGTPDDWKMAEVVDYYGTSIYPKHSSSAAPWSVLRRAGSLDFIRSSGRRNRGFYIGELQAGFGTTGVRVSDPVTPEDIEDWTWSALARGARSVSYYAYYPMSTGYESGGYGLIELDGTVTPRARRAGAIAELVARNAAFFLQASPPAADVAILYNPLAHLVGGEQSGGVRGGVRDSCFGYYRALYDRNVPVDFVHALELERGDWGRYKLLIVPYPPMLSRGAARAIERFVAEGGRVLGEARAAWNDERGAATPVVPGGGLDRVFGCRELEVRPRKTSIRLTSRLKGAGEPAGSIAFEGAVYEEVLRPTAPEARAVARFPDGAVAAVANRYGKGEALLVGSFAGMAHETAPSAGFGEFVGEVLDWAGIQPPLRIRASGGPAPEVRILASPAGRLLVAFNRGDAPLDLSVEYPEPAAAAAEAWTPETPVRPGEGARGLRVAIPARRVAAVFLR